MESSPDLIVDHQHKIDFVLLRNDFLDAFSDLETEISKVLQSCGIGNSKEPFGQRLQKFRGVSKTTLIANTNYPKRDRLADKIGDILPIRADLIHSHMVVRTVNSEPSARFVNSQDAYARYPQGREMSLTDLQGLVASVSDLTLQIKELRRVANPAS